MLFVALTVLTIYAQPAPLKLGAQKLALLEERVLAAGKAGWQVRCSVRNSQDIIRQACVLLQIRIKQPCLLWCPVLSLFDLPVRLI